MTHSYKLCLSFKLQKQETNENFDRNSPSVDILSNNSNETQAERELGAEVLSSEPPQTTTSLSNTSKLKCEFICDASDEIFVSYFQSDRKL
jgi:hypothetical protein